MSQPIIRAEAEPIFVGGRVVDQTLYGMAAISHLLSGEENGGKTLRGLFGSTTCAPISPMGGRPYEFFLRVGHEHWPDLDTLLNEHLLFPLYRAVVSPERYEVGFAGAKQPGRSASDVVQLGLHSLRRGTRDGGLKMCPLCVNEDSEAGPALWRLSHQIPWVTHCWRHGTPLIARCPMCGAKLAPEKKPCMPRSVCQVCKASLFIEAVRNDFETHVACFYLEIQIARGEHISPEDRLAAYRARMTELGYASEGDAVRAFISDVYTSAMREHDGKLFNRLSDPRDWDFSFNTLFRSKSQMITRHEALFLPWLFNQWSDVLAYSRRPRAPDEHAKLPVRESNSRRPESPDQLEARLLAAMGRGLTPFAAARECKVAVLFGKYLAHKIGHPMVARRADYAQIDQSMILKVIELARGGMYTSKIAVTMRLSLTEASVIRRVYHREIGDAGSVARRALKIHEAKDRLRRMVSDGRWLTASQLRQEALVEYVLVLESDPGWIEDLLTSSDLYASRQRLAKLAAADDELLALLRELDARWALNPPPFRKTKRRIYSELAGHAWTLDDLKRLPKSKAFADSMVETGRVANSRRIEATLAALHSDATVREISQHCGIDGHRVREVLASSTSP